MLLYVYKQNTAHTKKGEKKSMADTKNTKTEVGIIGQTYQNRRNKKIGTLESRNEKYKTLCMKGVDGKTFDVVYSTFKSDWRKLVSDSETTSEKASEKKAEKTAPAKDTKKVEKTEQTEKTKLSMEERVKAVMSAKSVLEELVEKSKLPLTIKSLSKGGLAVKQSRKTVFEIWPHPERNNFDFVSNAKASFSDKSVVHEHKNNWILKEVYTVKNLNTSIKEMLNAVKDDVLAKDKKKED